MDKLCYLKLITPSDIEFGVIVDLSKMGLYGHITVSLDKSLISKIPKDRILETILMEKK